MYSGITISDSPKQIAGELYSNENAETYIEYTLNGTLFREEVLGSSIRKIEDPKVAPTPPL